jgi:hypothetical protein
VHALRNIYAALVPDGMVVDTQPVSAHPPVAADGVTLGTLDMRDWSDTIQAIDKLFAETIADGLYELQHESRLVVTDSFDSGPECLEVVAGWRGARVPAGVATELAAATTQVTVEQQVRLRLLRRVPERSSS